MADEPVVEDVPQRPDERRVGRRRLINGLAIGGAIVGVGTASAAVARATGGSVYRSKQLTVDVACLGQLWREGAILKSSGDNDFRTPFAVEGWIYPAGTIIGDGFVALEEGSTGRWFCRGYNVGGEDRPEPHVNSHQDFLFGTIRPDRVFPPSMISTAGIEGTLDPSQVSIRAIIGGTGAYLGATGEVRGYFLGLNNTVIFPDLGQAPCWRFEFDMRVLETADGPTE